jgi:hypothetical protein
VGGDGVREKLVMRLEEPPGTLIAHPLHESGRVHEIREQIVVMMARAASAMAPLPRGMVEQIRLDGDTAFRSAHEELRAARRRAELGQSRRTSNGGS